MDTQFGTNKNIIFHAIFAKIDKTAFAVATGFIFFLGMFAITALLIFKEISPENPIGSNLQLLSNYLPGYNLTWFGNVTGSLFAGIIGAMVGFLFAGLWNLVHYLYLAVIISRLHLLDDN
jgi:hypothetical protein